MNAPETENDTPEPETEETAPCDTGQFQKLMEQCGCGCGPMRAKMMAAMATDKDPAEGQEKNKCC